LVKSSRRGHSFGGCGHANLYSYHLHLEFKNEPFWTNKWEENFRDNGDTCVYFDFPEKHIAIDIYHSYTDTNTKKVYFKLQLFNRDEATDEDKKFVESVADQYSLTKKDDRYYSQEDSKEEIVSLLKQIMQVV
jgi:hypothetical protein